MNEESESKNTAENNGEISRIAGAEDEEARIYEVGYHLVPTISPDDLPKEAARVKDALALNGGAVISEEEPKLASLAYRIAKTVENRHVLFDSAYFGWVKFTAPQSAPAALKKALDANTAILRFIIIKTVRENTLVRKSLFFARRPEKEGESEIITKKSAPEESGPIDEAALDKQLEELVIE